MYTERYTINFFGVDADYFTNDFLMSLWDACAEREYKHSRIYVSALVEAKELVCGKIRGCDVPDFAYVITSVRNPVEAEDKDAYFDALKRVIKEVRKNLGNPCMSIYIDSTEYYYFIQR